MWGVGAGKGKGRCEKRGEIGGWCVGREMDLGGVRLHDGEGTHLFDAAHLGATQLHAVKLGEPFDGPHQVLGRERGGGTGGVCGNSARGG